jgi:hypothetical protein
MRTTETEIKFARPFVLGSLVVPLAAGTYRLKVDEELIDGISFVAYRKVAAFLELPSIATPAMSRQQLLVSHAEIEAVLLKDNCPIAELPEDHA